ncbi:MULTISPECIES: group II intron reverse transcriptase/maturase [Methylocaldum]|uniref:group II intron reverse transcriptase/maturase n=1 Tax=unclassified Methylocaldum TaxID=2622260 RepID=UPI00197BA669|nr:group II intron reverse transcriptase/maturase [Methylocaldum sp. 14B]
MSDSVSTMNPTGGADVRRGVTQPALHDDLMERVLDRANLRRAWKRVKANRGAPGMDGMRIEDFAEFARSHWAEIRQQLADGSYQPQAVRRVSIPKPGGGERLLGIPTVMDRVIQQAIAQVLTPIFDPGFSESSFGFRPGRSAHGALRQAQGHLQAGYRIACDLDLAKFFDNVRHDVLMARVARKVGDKRLLALVGRYLRAGVLVGESIQVTALGTPQGGPLSPLLANILLDDLDKELEGRGHRFVRYADDLLILVKSQRAGERVKDSVTRFLTGTLKLVVNEQKSRVVKTDQAKFLGFNFRGTKLRWGDRAFEDFKHNIRTLTGRSWGVSMAHRFYKLAQYIRGWMGYFGISDYYRPIPELDHWLRRRVRMCYWKQWRYVRTKVKNLLGLGTSKRQAILTAISSKSYWHLSRTLATQTGMTNQWLKTQGLITIRDLWMKAHGYT